MLLIYCSYICVSLYFTFVLLVFPCVSLCCSDINFPIIRFLALVSSSILILEIISIYMNCLKSWLLCLHRCKSGGAEIQHIATKDDIVKQLKYKANKLQNFKNWENILVIHHNVKSKREGVLRVASFKCLLFFLW